MSLSPFKIEDKVLVSYPFTISALDYADNESFAVTIYFHGCSHNCDGCHNNQHISEGDDSSLKSFTYKELEEALINFLKKNRLDKCVLMGGDPLFEKNLDFTSKLLYNNPTINFMIYTGYGIEYVKKLNLKHFEFLKCGKFNKKLFQHSVKNEQYIQFASSNQELYDHNYNILSENGIYRFN